MSGEMWGQVPLNIRGSGKRRVKGQERLGVVHMLVKDGFMSMVTHARPGMAAFKTLVTLMSRIYLDLSGFALFRACARSTR